jgi:hypothetical protein
MDSTAAHQWQHMQQAQETHGSQQQPKASTKGIGQRHQGRATAWCSSTVIATQAACLNPEICKPCHYRVKHHSFIHSAGVCRPIGKPEGVECHVHHNLSAYSTSCHVIQVVPLKPQGNDPCSIGPQCAMKSGRPLPLIEPLSLRLHLPP